MLEDGKQHRDQLLPLIKFSETFIFCKMDRNLLKLQTQTKSEPTVFAHITSNLTF